jgi:hypothetical protein
VTSSGADRLSALRQIQRNLALADEWLPDFKAGDALRRDAARRLFSVLTHLERIAVLAAERGRGVEGQLDDEIAHERTFRKIAEALGGLEPAPASVARLTDYLSGLSASESTVCLNVVAEAWLENVFRFAVAVGPWKAMIDVIEAEEARHSREALASARMRFGEAKTAVARLEEHLWRISTDPAFMWPLAWFAGVPAVAKMGQAAVGAHRRACRVLGVKPGGLIENVALCGREGLGAGEPKLHAANEWERAALEAGLRPISATLAIRWYHQTRNLALVEAEVAKAVGAVLAAYPHLNRTVVDARQEIWLPAHPVVGVRRLYDRRRVMTVYHTNPQSSTSRALAEALGAKAEKMRACPYLPPPSIQPGLARLAPASRCAATITNVVGMYPEGTDGHSSLAPNEGATWSVCVIGFERRGFRRHLRVFVEADHRAHNGLELGEFVTSLKKHLEF